MYFLLENHEIYSLLRAHIRFAHQFCADCTYKSCSMFKYPGSFKLQFLPEEDLVFLKNYDQVWWFQESHHASAAWLNEDLCTQIALPLRQEVHQHSGLWGPHKLGSHVEPMMVQTFYFCKRQIIISY